MGSPPEKMEQPGALQARFEDGVPSSHDHPEYTELDVGDLLAAKYVSTIDDGIGDGKGVTSRQAVDSRSAPLTGAMSVVCRRQTKQGGLRVVVVVVLAVVVGIRIAVHHKQ